LDLSFNPGTGGNNRILDVAYQPDGKVLISGDLTSGNGLTRNRIARINTDGGLDGSFNPGVGCKTQILSLAYQPDGKVLVGGGFTSYRGAARNRIARLNADGTWDGSFVRRETNPIRKVWRWRKEMKNTPFGVLTSICQVSKFAFD
jgi:uncharacterized delta-60 repeat protein